MRTDDTEIKTHPITVCPVTGLPVKSQSDWTDRKLGSGYQLTTRVVGNRILWNQPAGHAELNNIIESLNLTDTVLRDHIDQSAGFVQISDFSGMQGISWEARKYYIRHMEQRENMLGLIYFGVNPLFKLMIKLAKRLSIVQFNVFIATDYTHAMSMAARLIGVAPLSPSPSPVINGPLGSSIAEHCVIFNPDSPEIEAPSENSTPIVDQVIQFIGDIDWEHRGAPIPNHMDENHPFYPVFEAIALLKGELDVLFEERRSAEGALRESQKQFSDKIDALFGKKGA